MKAYCPECGTKHEYTINKPNFCVNCGYSFAGAPPKKAPDPVQAEVIEEETEEEAISASYSDMSSLDIEMEINPRKGVSLGDIMASTLEEEQVNLDDLPKPKTQQISKEQVKKQFQSEAGAIRPKNNLSQGD